MVLDSMLQLNNKYHVVIISILIASAFAHLWNAVGFPDIFYDEGVYMRRAMHVLSGLGPQESWYHDHPFFGQIFLAGALAITGYPNSLNPTVDVHSLEMLYLVPRIIMGLLAVLDTFLIYKITEKKYGKNIAIIASVLFAVMPITWFLRRILLDSILLPFLLSSILFALKTSTSTNKYGMALLSGICLGVAIFTKIPVFTMIPLVAGLVYFGTGKNPKYILLWLLPVILIPLIWPLQSISVGQFSLWIKDVIGQAQRSSSGLPYISLVFFKHDPVLFVLGISGTIFAIMKRNYFILFWFVPFVIFLYLIGYNQYFYWIPILPVFCITAAILISELSGKISKKQFQRPLLLVLVLGICIFGLTSTIMLITTNVSKSEFETMVFVLQHVKNNTDTTILSSPTYSWIFDDIFHKENVPIDYSMVLFRPIKTDNVLLVADPHFLIDIGRGKQLSQVYNTTRTIATFDSDVSKYDLSMYPYTSMAQNYEGSHIEVKINQRN